MDMNSKRIYYLFRAQSTQEIRKNKLLLRNDNLQKTGNSKGAMIIFLNFNISLVNSFISMSNVKYNKNDSLSLSLFLSLSL